jgi:hypothetical protein
MIAWVSCYVKLNPTENIMKRLVWLAAATIISAGIPSTPSMAQPRLELGIGPNGPSVGIRDPEQERRERWRARREWEERQARREARRGFYNPGDTGGIGRCRTIITRQQDQWGRTVEERERRCR